ncbi:ABC transporter permease [Dellaglioa algida]|uniref:ABC transporter permease n=1 Tax=Dellaglioa algida TaxID=105612 RepID=UPI0024C4D951|nr:ABC transporter permease [Dellaglioa algida]MDK1728466.1 ABC transporter permease [Dellaglioa algida]MDK1736130.1 ABC transporter permease [Dellaglioa algida]MDK1737831.1 ABC transporter permease [Dellaglioa algida]
MQSLIKRHLSLYFGNRSGVFFSLMGALISFILYLVFLKQNMVANWASVPDTKLLLDSWLIGGTLVVTAISATSYGLSQMIKDRESGALSDLYLTDISYIGIQISYFVSAIIIGIVMQVVMLLGMEVYFIAVDGIDFQLDIILPLLGTIVLSSVVWTTFNLLLFSFVKKVDSLGKINAIIGTASGFFAGVYMPMGSVPNTAQLIMKLTPAPYNASIFRQILVKQQLDESFQKATVADILEFKKSMGIGINLNELTTIQQNGLILGAFTVIFIIAALILAGSSRRSVVSRV